MRDLLITLMVFGAIPFILKRPHIGILVWSWLGYMNPHRFAYGFAYNMPFAQITFLAMFAGMLFSKEKKTFPVNSVTIVWAMFIAWAMIATIFATNMDGAQEELNRFIKIQIAVACTLMLMTNKERIIQLVWVIVLSLGFYGFKGGIFSIATGMQYKVNGARDSFYSGNNEAALALLMIIPLIYFLKLHSKSKYIRLFLLLTLFLCAVSVIASYSRGAFLAGMVTMLFLWLGMAAKPKMISAAVVLSMIVAAAPFVPEKWYDRMNTIETYEEDSSAMGRVNAWTMAFNMANDRPLVGGGLRAFTTENFYKYAPVPDDHHDAHSIYFEVLGEMGYVGLFLFLLLWLLVYLQAKAVIKETKNNNEHKWMADLTKMTQVSLIAFLTGGAFLGLAFSDLPYHLMCLAVLPGVILQKYVKEQECKDVRSRL